MLPKMRCSQVLWQLGFQRLAAFGINGIDGSLFFQTSDQFLHHAAQFRWLAGHQILLLKRILGQIEELVVRVLGDLAGKVMVDNFPIAVAIGCEVIRVMRGGLAT